MATEPSAVRNLSWNS